MTINERLISSGAAALPARVAVYVPGTVNVDGDGAAAAEMWTRRTAEDFSRLFGGATVTDAAGYWVSDSAGLVREAVRIVYASAPAAVLDEHAAEVLEIVQRIKAGMGQEAVSVEVNGALYLV